VEIFQKPAGQTLFEPELIFTFFYLFLRQDVCYLVCDRSSKTAIKHPKHRKEQNKVCPFLQGQGTLFVDEERKWQRSRQSNNHHRCEELTYNCDFA
jgi:hypothetical protein